MKVIQLYPNFKTYGGAEKCILTLHQGFKRRGIDSKIGGFGSFESIHPNLKIEKSDYIQVKLSNFRELRQMQMLSHHRKISTLWLLLSWIISTRNLIHIAHNEFHSLKLVTLYPKRIIAVSEAVKSNLIEYWGLKSSTIKVVYNGIEDLGYSEQKLAERIKILIPARINRVKRQEQILNLLHSKLHPNIDLYFVGDGEDYERLKSTYSNHQIHFQGFSDNMKSWYDACDYVLLYSEREGLPTVFLEALSVGRPIIGNAVGGIPELVAGNCGILLQDDSHFISLFSGTELFNASRYQEMQQCARVKFEQHFKEEHYINRYIQYLNAGTEPHS